MAWQNITINSKGRGPVTYTTNIKLSIGKLCSNAIIIKISMIIPKQNEIIFVYSLLFYTPQKNLQMQSNVIWIKQLYCCVLLPSTVSKQSHRHMRNFVLPAGWLSGCRIHQLNFIEPANQSSMKQEHAHHRPQMSCLSRIHKPSSSSNQGD